jgi:hypothetical protein
MNCKHTLYTHKYTNIIFCHKSKLTSKKIDEHGLLGSDSAVVQSVATLFMLRKTVETLTHMESLVVAVSDNNQKPSTNIQPLAYISQISI